MSSTQFAPETVNVGRLSVTSHRGRSADLLCFRADLLCFRADLLRKKLR